MSAEEDAVVLVIDDCEDNLFLLELILIEDGYRVEKADCGEKGLAKANRLIPDLIILDMMMPDMSGIEVTKSLQTSQLLSQIPVLLCTANRFVKSKDIEGIADICYKPFDINDILVRIRSLINRERGLKTSTLVVDVDENDPLYLEHQRLVAQYGNDHTTLEVLQTEGYEIVENPELR